MNKLSLYIREKREEKGITIEELSKRTLISPAVLKDIEAGKFDKYSGEEAYVKMYLKKISNALEVDKALEKLKMETRRYAKRQLTWFSNHSNVTWIEIKNENNFDWDALDYNNKFYVGDIFYASKESKDKEKASIDKETATKRANYAKYGRTGGWSSYSEELNFTWA